MNFPQLEIDDLAAVVRESMAAQRNDDKQIRVAEAVSPENRAPELKLQPEFQPHSDHRYHINDLLRFHDRAFVQAAYRAVLKRSPDETESLRELKRLRSGNVNKIDLLAALRFSHEGRAKGVQLDGLLLPALIRRMGQLPLIGYAIRLGIAFVRLPNLVRDQREFSGYIFSQHEQITDFLNQLSARITDCRNEVSRLDETLSKQLETLAAEQQGAGRKQADFARIASEQFSVLDQRNETLAAELKSLSRLEQESAERQATLNQSIAEQRQLIATAQNELQSEIARLYLQLQHARSELTIQGNSINALSTRGPDASPAREAIPAETHNLDALYAALEDRFRGTREEIKERFKVYLPYVNDLAPVIDLGCGRGEWLEILSEAGIEARGVDTNRIQIDQCRARGLNVTDEDFIVHLRGLADASVGAVTGFHVIEHVSLDTLITLLNEVLRVLRPRGVVIFETPNPENVLVGSKYFYMDPTHRHPLPSELMEFLLESRGFHGIEIVNLHPWESAKIAGDHEVTDRFNAYFYGPMDYGVVGRKVGP